MPTKRPCIFSATIHGLNKQFQIRDSLRRFVQSQARPFTRISLSVWNLHHCIYAPAATSNNHSHHSFHSHTSPGTFANPLTAAHSGQFLPQTATPYIVGDRPDHNHHDTSGHWQFVTASSCALYSLFSLPKINLACARASEAQYVVKQAGRLAQHSCNLQNAPTLEVPLSDRRTCERDTLAHKRTSTGKTRQCAPKLREHNLYSNSTNTPVEGSTVPPILPFPGHDVYKTPVYKYLSPYGPL